MRIEVIEIRPYAVPLRPPLRTARGSIDRREGAIVIARSDEGTAGFGEIAPLAPFSRETAREARAAAHAIAARLRGVEIADAGIPADPSGVRGRLDASAYGLDLPPSTAFGLETALADLAARSADRPLARWLNRDAAARVRVNALLAAAPPAKGRERDPVPALEAIRRGGYGTVKIKVGAGSIEADAARVAAVRRELGPGVAIRLDANRAWPYDRAAAALRRLAPLGIAYVEEPLAAGDIDRLPALRRAAGVPTALDETLAEPARFDRLLGSGAVAAVVIKPSLAGGIGPTLALARRAEAAGARAVITTLLETAIGTAACLHLAAALGPDPPACGLDTLRRLAGRAIPNALEVRDGALDVPDGPGLGIPIETGGPGR